MTESTKPTNALARVENADQGAMMQVSDVKYRLDSIEDLMRSVMKKGPSGDYGAIPGTGDKAVLLKPGAEKLCTLFRLSPTYTIQVTPMPKDHREYTITCTLTHITDGKVWGQGMGSATTMESKWRWRKASRKCPHCSADAIIKGKEEFGGGWLCYKAKGGCGAKFGDDDRAIVGQEVGRVENADIADVYNTCLKIATKRAMVAAVLITTGASALFTQDLDEEAPEQTPAAKPAARTAPATPPAAKPSAAKPPAPSPAPLGEQRGEFEDRIASCTLAGQSDASATRPWKRWEVKTMGGDKFSTFSETVASKCETAAAEEVTVKILWLDKGKGAVIEDVLSTTMVQGELV